MNDMSRIDLAWVAGLLEGEGSFCSVGDVASVQMVSTDADVIATVHRITGLGNVGTVKRKIKPKHSPQRYWRVTRQADVRLLLEALLPLMHRRRANQIYPLMQNLDRKLGRRGKGLGRYSKLQESTL